MQKRELIKEVSTLTACTQSNVEAVLTTFNEVVTKAFANGETVGLKGFGTFEARERAPRVGRNPGTGEAVPIPACRTPYFVASKQFKKIVNE